MLWDSCRYLWDGFGYLWDGCGYLDIISRAMRRGFAPNPGLRWWLCFWLLFGPCITPEQCRPRRHSNVAHDDTNRNIRATEIPNRKEDRSESGLDCALLRTFQSEKLLDRRKNAPARDLGRLNADRRRIRASRFAIC